MRVVPGLDDYIRTMDEHAYCGTAVAVSVMDEIDHPVGIMAIGCPGTAAGGVVVVQYFDPMTPHNPQRAFTSELKPRTSSPNALFGSAVALSYDGLLLAVGTPGLAAASGVRHAGGVHTYSLLKNELIINTATWTPKATMSLSAARDGQSVGQHVAIVTVPKSQLFEGDDDAYADDGDDAYTDNTAVSADTYHVLSLIQPIPALATAGDEASQGWALILDDADFVTTPPCQHLGVDICATLNHAIDWLWLGALVTSGCMQANSAGTYPIILAPGTFYAPQAGVRIVNSVTCTFPLPPPPAVRTMCWLW